MSVLAFLVKFCGTVVVMYTASDGPLVSGSLMVMVLMVEFGREQRGVLVAASVAISVTLEGEPEGECIGAVEDAPLDVGEDADAPAPLSYVLVALFGVLIGVFRVG